MSLQQDDLTPARYDSRLLRRLLRYLRPHIGALVAAFVAMVISSVAELAQPWIVQQAIDLHFLPGDLDGLGRLVVLFGVCLAAAFAAEYAQTVLLQNTGQRV